MYLTIEYSASGTRAADQGQIFDRDVSMVAADPEHIPFHTPDYRVVRLAQPSSADAHRIKDRLHVGRRAADHLEDLRRRRLPLERFLGLVEQAHVLDRD